MDPLIYGGLAVVACLVGLHGLDRYLDRLDAQEQAHRKALRRAQALRELGKAPAAPGTMRRRYSDVSEPGDHDGDQGGWPHRDAA